MLRLLLLLGAADAALLRPTADSVAFRAGQHGYRTYRIPGFVSAQNGALLALAEGRVRVAGRAVVRRAGDEAGGHARSRRNSSRHPEAAGAFAPKTKFNIKRRAVGAKPFP